MYRLRFLIESSYRMRNQVKPQTSTKNPIIRYLHALISFLRKNIRIALLWRYVSPVKQRPRTIDMCMFRFERFIVIVGEAIRASMRMVKEPLCYPNQRVRSQFSSAGTETDPRFETP